MDVLIADDHALLAQAVADILQRSDESRVKVVTSRQAAVEEISRQPYDIILLDLRMPGMHGLSSVGDIVKRGGEASIVLFTGQVDRKFLADAIDSGIRGYIPKSMPLKSLEVALKLIHTGQVFVPQIDYSSEEASQRTGGGSSVGGSGSSSGAGSSGGGALTDRELHVLRFAAEGATNKEIARMLGVPETQIKMVMRSVCAKLPARNRAHASVIAHERMLI